MDNGIDKKQDDPKQFEFSVGGYKVKYSNKLLAIIITVAPILGGSLWVLLLGMLMMWHLRKK